MFSNTVQFVESYGNFMKKIFVDKQCTAAELGLLQQSHSSIMEFAQKCITNVAHFDVLFSLVIHMQIY